MALKSYFANHCFSFAFNNLLCRLWKGKSGSYQRAMTCSSKPICPCQSQGGIVQTRWQQSGKWNCKRQPGCSERAPGVPSNGHWSPACPDSRGFCFPSLALLTPMALCHPLPCSSPIFCWAWTVIFICRGCFMETKHWSLSFPCQSVDLPLVWKGIVPSPEQPVCVVHAEEENQDSSSLFAFVVLPQGTTVENQSLSKLCWR